MLSKENIQYIYRLSPMQEGIYFYSLIENYSSAYFEQVTFNISGRFDISSIKMSLNDILKRYDILRTVFTEKSSKNLLQIVLKEREFDFFFLDITNETNKEEIIKNYIQKDKDRGFDLKKDVLIRVSILQREEQAYTFIWSHHHIIMDGWCMGILISEFFQIYNAYIQNKNLLLPRVNQYKSYIDWLSSQSENKAKKYWDDYLKGFDAIIELPKKTDKSGIYKREEKLIELNPELYNKLRTIAVNNNVTLNSVIQAIWGILIAKFNDQNDVVFGAVVSGRPGEIDMVDTMVGLFINTIPIRIKINPNLIFSELIKNTQKNMIESEPFCYLSLAQIQPLTELRRDLINHIFVFENYPSFNELNKETGEDEAQKYIISNVKAHEQTNYDFNILIKSKEQLLFRFIYNQNVFSEEAVTKIENILVHIINQVTGNCLINISEINILTVDEKNKILNEFNNTTVNFPTNKTIIDLFEKTVLDKALNNALIHDDIILSYEELNSKSNIVAKLLREKGVGRNTIVPFICERTLETLIGIFGILKAGGIYLPIDNQSPAERTNYILKDTNAQIVLLINEVNITPEINIELICIKDLLDANAGLKVSNLPKKNIPEDFAYMIYTSGSTGQPKGVLVRHGSLVNQQLWTELKYGIEENDLILHKTPLTFDVSVFELFLWSTNGASLCILDSGKEKEPSAIIEAVKKYKITRIHFVPSMLNVFLTYLEENGSYEDLRNLKCVFCSGEALLIEHVNKFYRLIGNPLAIRLYNLYGPTEATIHVSYYDCPNNETLDSIPIGKPNANNQLFILNKELNIQPVGIIGELAIAGIGIAAGYLNKAELTSAQFVYSPFLKQLVYKTGDLARWLSDGNIEYLGRIDFQVKINGNRIELDEISNTLLKYQGITEAVVSVYQDKNKESSLCAYYVCEHELDILDVREFLKKKLPSYMIPVHFIKLNEMPLTSSGKINRKSLPEPTKDHLVNTKYEKPSTEIENILVNIWNTVLGIDKIGIQDNYFLLGGDSIKAILISSKIRQEGYILDINSIFEYCTIAELAHQVKKQKRMIDQNSIVGRQKISPIQKYLFNLPDVNHNYFNQALLLNSKHGFDENCIRAVFNQLQEHHDALRMTFMFMSNDILQINNDINFELSLTVFDFRGIKEVTALLTENINKIQASINIEQGPLMKLGLFHLDNGDRLLIVINHLVIDGISWRIVLEDIELLIKQYQNKEKLSLPLKTDSYLLWSKKLEEYSDNEELIKEKVYWDQVCSTAIAPIKTDQETVDLLIKDMSIGSISLLEEETHSLLTSVNEAYKTNIEDILLTAFAISVKKVFDINKVLVALESHGREQIIDDIDITRTVGWFTSIYPVILEISNDYDISTQIKEIKETLHRVPHKGIGYMVLKYYKNTQFNLNPDILFNYLGHFGSKATDSFLRVASESTGNAQDENNYNPYKIEINCMISAGKLTISIKYNNKLFLDKTINELLKTFNKEISQIISHCINKDKIELTPSDFNDKDLTIEELNMINNLI